ncbi:hypothetical protein BDP27DRAFT_1329831 [Rhodocollybia butyracea]|uniref:Uncharacterized protein n=1 Tax=Rhodocollybia butyracea TaxID=206335 RepID=A0A9P5PJE2_9AGAR|nr:hypothetical protein BDP27DRAFT_1329831 [Rhodocollybia butyracea]
MTRSSGNLASSVAFPSSNNSQDRTSVYSVQSSVSTNSSDSQLPPPLALPYLPFRRISLPSLPPQYLQHSALQRQSTQQLLLQRSSVASFESFPETNGRESSPMGRNYVMPKTNALNSPHVTPRKAPRRSAISMHVGTKPPSLSPMRRKSQALAALPPDDALLVKRRKVMMEFYETEKAYVNGLDLIYEHFLLPILNSLETSTPILDRPLLTAVFSNFVDVWNLHRSFYSELTKLFWPVGSEQRNTPPSSPQREELQDGFPSFPPSMSPVLLAHFPYLSLYTPFITAFPHTLAALNTLLTPSYHYRQQARAQTRAAAARAQSATSASPAKGSELKYERRFAEFVATQEKDPRCGRLTLRDWLLTIVQRCPRYLLLLGDLLSCTPGEAQVPWDDGKEGVEQLKEKVDRERRKWYREATKEEEKEREKLVQVFGLVSKITTSLNTSISSHSQALSLLALQRSTPNLPLDEFQFISPGRTLLKRGTLLQIENPDARVKRGESKDGDMRPREREFLLFSDCLVWLANEETEKREKEWSFDLSSIWSSLGGSGGGSLVSNSNGERPKSTALTRPTPSIVEEEIDTNGEGNHPSGSDNLSAIPLDLSRPLMVRTRSKSEAAVTTVSVASTSNHKLDSTNLPTKSKPALPEDQNARRPHHKSNFARINKNSALHLHFREQWRGRQNNSSTSAISAGYGHIDQQQWLYKGRIELVNLEIVVDTSARVEEDNEESGDPEVQWRWEVLSPEGSFVLYAASAQDRFDWTTLIRQAKSQQLVSLNAHHPNSTLTSSEATQHVRRALQALPFAPNDVRMQETRVLVKGEGINIHHESSAKGKERAQDSKRHKRLGSKDKELSPDWYKERRSKVEHWVPAIWIPDEKAEGCMRCGRAFGWRRRRHHCRICGRCVCSSCSEKTFYISDPNAKDEETDNEGDSTVRGRPHPPMLPHSSISDPTMSYVSNTDTITSLSQLPSWMTMSVPSLALSSSSNTTGVGARKAKDVSGPEALMAIDRKRYSYAEEWNRSSRDSEVVFDLDSPVDEIAAEDFVHPARSGSRIKLRSPSSSGLRPKSYHEIMEDFNAADSAQAQSRAYNASPVEEMANEDENDIPGSTSGDGEDSSALSGSSVPSSRLHTAISLSPSASSGSLSISPPGALSHKGKGRILVSKRKEDTARRNKRFSMPAVALHPTSVVARTHSILPSPSHKSVTFTEGIGKGDENKRSGASRFGGSMLSGMPSTRSKRFSMVLGGRQARGNDHTSGSKQLARNTGHNPEGDLAKGVAASKLTELLRRSKQAPVN